MFTLFPLVLLLTIIIWASALQIDGVVDVDDDNVVIIRDLYVL